jgi:hypothetical protein
LLLMRGTTPQRCDALGELFSYVLLISRSVFYLRDRCVLELHAIACKKQEGEGRFGIAMTADENLRFLTGIAADHREYYNMLGRVNAETSDCSRAADRELIHEDIKRSVGFAKLNRMLFGVMENWMEEQLRFQISMCAGDEALLWISTLAVVLHEQGRLDEASDLREMILEAEERRCGGRDARVGMNQRFFMHRRCIDSASSQVKRWAISLPHI